MIKIVPGSGRSILGEGPLWSERKNAVFWVDILGKRLNRLSLADGTVKGWVMPEPIGWAIEREQGGLIAGLASGFVELDLEPFAIRPIIDPEPGITTNRMNDAKADSAGRIWAGTMSFSGQGDSGALYRLDPDHRCTRVDGPYVIPNGPAIDPGGRWMFHTDSARRTIFRIAMHDDDSLGPRKPFIVFPSEWGSPDGMTLDAEGHLWVAHWGVSLVSRFDPNGVRERSILLPATQITSMAFAGPALDRMFVTSAADNVREPEAGALFEVEPGCRGLPTLRFGG